MDDHGEDGAPIQSIKPIALSLHGQFIVLGTVSEVKTWQEGLWAFAGGNTSCTVGCFKFTVSHASPCCYRGYPFWFESSSESVPSFHRALRTFLEELLYRTVYFLQESTSYLSKKSRDFTCYSEVWVWPQRNPGEECRIDGVRHCVKTRSICWPRFIELGFLNLRTYLRLT